MTFSLNDPRTPRAEGRNLHHLPRRGCPPTHRPEEPSMSTTPEERKAYAEALLNDPNSPHLQVHHIRSLLGTPAPLPIHRTEASYPNCSTCDGGGCPDCTDPA